VNCQETQGLLDAYVDGELDLVHTLAIEEHLQDCQVCTRLYKNRVGLHTTMSSGALRYQAPPRLAMQVQRTVRAASRAEAPARQVPWRWLSLAASFVLVALVTWGMARSVPRTPTEASVTQDLVASHIRSLMVDHLTDVGSSDQHTVKPWFDGKLDFAPQVKDLTQSGFPLVWGRLDYIVARPVAALVYGRRQHYINVFVWPTSAGLDSGQGPTTRQGYNMVSWMEGGLTYWAVSDTEMSDLIEFARLMRSPS
jgi:anti-sigma factor RsiW